MVEIWSLGPLNPDPPARRRVGGQAQMFPAQRGKLLPFWKSAVTAISKMVKNTALGPLNSDPPTVPTVGGKAQEFSLANSRALRARGYLRHNPREIIAILEIGRYGDFENGEKHCLRAIKL